MIVGHDLSLHLSRSSLITFITVVYFSVFRSYACFVRIFGAVADGTFLFSIFSFSSLVYRSTIDFCITDLEFCDLTKLTCFPSFVVDSL